MPSVPNTPVESRYRENVPCSPSSDSAIICDHVLHTIAEKITPEISPASSVASGDNKKKFEIALNNNKIELNGMLFYSIY